MERPDFFQLENGKKVKLPFSKEEYNSRFLSLELKWIEIILI